MRTQYFFRFTLGYRIDIRTLFNKSLEPGESFPFPISRKAGLQKISKKGKDIRNTEIMESPNGEFGNIKG